MSLQVTEPVLGDDSINQSIYWAATLEALFLELETLWWRRQGSNPQTLGRSREVMQCMGRLKYHVLTDRTSIKKKREREMYYHVLSRSGESLRKNTQDEGLEHWVGGSGTALDWVMVMEAPSKEVTLNWGRGLCDRREKQRAQNRRSVEVWGRARSLDSFQCKESHWGFWAEKRPELMCVFKDHWNCCVQNWQDLNPDSSDSRAQAQHKKVQSGNDNVVWEASEAGADYIC